MRHHGFRSISRAAFVACIFNLFTLGCATESRDDLFSPLVDAFVTEDTTPSMDVSETNEAADLSEPDVGADTTPGPGIEPDHQCEEDKDCSSPVGCAQSICVPVEGVRTCLVIAKANFCEDSDPCTFDACNTNPQTAAEFAEFGCTHKPRGCDDGNSCTIDVCDSSELDGCVATTDPKACDDNDACTKDTCLPGGSCGYTPQNCDDGDETTIDGCVASTGCYHTSVECKLESECLNPNPCIITGCVFGKCVSKPMNCDDGVDCTGDVCIGGLCANIENCTDNELCTDPVCNIPTGTCQTIPAICNDGNPCTTDFCTEDFGCDSDKIAGCCQDAAECQDGDACTFEFCDLAINSCVADYIKVDDGIKCTVDACLVGGFIDHHANDAFCLNKNGTPLEGNKTKCSFNYGCVECLDYLDCNDNDPCTYDYCSQNVCTHEVRCNAPEVCVIQGNNSYCELPQGFCIADGQCNDYNPCTEDTCLDSFCDHNPNKVCDDGDKCTVDSCHPVYGCIAPGKNCEDNNVCTTYDHCNPTTGECEYKEDVYCIQCDTNSDCVAGTICVENASVAYSGACNNGSCFYGGVEVCKNSPCDISTCTEGNCTWQLKDCDDKSACTLDLCDYNQGCEHIEGSCNDYNGCTNDSCDPTVGCIHTWNRSLCPEHEYVSPCKGYWNCKECNQTSDCTDNDPATLDQCILKVFDDICTHKFVSNTFGIGLGNFSQEGKQYSVDIQWSDGSFYSNMLLEPGGTLYNHDFNMVKVYGVRDMETGEELDVVPPAIACINYDSTLVTGVLDADGVLTCQ